MSGRAEGGPQARWLRRPRTALLFWGLLLAAAGAGGFVYLANAVRAGDTLALDRWAVRAMRTAHDAAVPIGPRWLPETSRDATALGSIGVLSLLTLAIAGYLWLDRKFWMTLYLLAATATGLGLSLGLKHLFDRPRQTLVPPLSHAYTTSFPSGHSFLAAVVYLTLGALLATVITRKRLQVYVIVVAVTLTIMVGLSRLYLGMHYPSDIVAGWMAGAAWAVLCWVLARWLQRHHRLETPAAPSAPRT